MSSANLTRYLEGQRNNKSFDTFYDRVLVDSKELTAEPILPRQRRPPRRFDGATTHLFAEVKSYFRQQYNQALDVASEQFKH